VVELRDVSITRFWTHAVTVLTPVWAPDRYGNVVPDWTQPPARRDATGWFTREATTEVVDGRETIVSDWSLSLPPDDPIGKYDRVERNGTVYTIVGDIERGEMPGGVHHLVVRLRSFTG
jgi:hypothetical protein